MGGNRDEDVWRGRQGNEVRKRGDRGDRRNKNKGAVRMGKEKSGRGGEVGYGVWEWGEGRGGGRFHGRRGGED